MSNLKFKAFVEHTPVAVAMLDRDLRYIMTSKRWLEDYELLGKDIIGKHHYKVLPHVKERWKEFHQHCLNGNTEKRDKDQITLPCGRIEWIKWEMHPWRDQDGDVGGIIIVREVITDRKMAEDKIAHYNQELENKVIERTKTLQGLSNQLRRLTNHLQDILEKERATIAREIHDELGQVLTALKLDLMWVDKRVKGRNKDVEDKLNNMISLIDTTIKSIQRICTELRPGILDDLGLVAAMEWQVNEFKKRSGLHCKLALNIEEEQIIGREITTNVFRILQEALTNILRHAQAKNVSINFKHSKQEIVLVVEDDGIGLVKNNLDNSNSFGLIGMRERVNALNGYFDIQAQKTKGTRITVKVPVNKKSSLAEDLMQESETV